MEFEDNKDKAAKFICDVWEPLTDNERAAIHGDITIKFYEKNDFIYRKSDSPQYMMCLTKGKVKICKEGVYGREQIIRVVKPQEMFGFRPFFADEDYMTSAMAFEPSEVAFIHFDTLLKLMNDNINICKFFIRQLSTELGNSDTRTINLTQKHIRGRLAEALLFLKEKYGVEEDGSTLGIYLSREDLANLSNMTTSNAIRTLSAFADEKLITIDGKKIKIIHDDELIRISSKG